MLVSAVEHVRCGWSDVDEVAENSVIYACIGFYIDYKGNVYGHAFPIYSTPKIVGGRYLWLEATLDITIPQSVWYLADFSRLLPVYFFNRKECYRIDKDYDRLGLTKTYVQEHQDLINAMVEYVETGKWLKVKWMHKGRRVPELTEKIHIS